MNCNGESGVDRGIPGWSTGVSYLRIENESSLLSIHVVVGEYATRVVDARSSLASTRDASLLSIHVVVGEYATLVVDARSSLASTRDASLLNHVRIRVSVTKGSGMDRSSTRVS